MNTARVIMWTGALGTAAGVGYAVHRYLRNGPANGAESEDAAARAEATESSEPAETATDAAEKVLRLDEPLAEPEHPNLKQRINQSRNVDGNVVESAEELLAQARKYIPDITLDELTGARLIASEHARATMTEAACIVDTECNRARRRGKTLHESLTRGHGFGKQGKKRVASTRRDPSVRHVLAARAVLSGKVRGVGGGATRFYDPYAMNKLNARYRSWDEGGRVGKRPPIVSCDALGLLEAWSFDYGKLGPNRCPPDRSKPGRRPMAWVGPIPGVDPVRLFLMKPMKLGEEHTRIYHEARAVLERGLAERGV